MTVWLVLLAVLGLLLLAAVVPPLVRLASAPPKVARFSADPDDETRLDPETGAVTSVQGADLAMPEKELERIWTPTHLEMLARTYWRFLTRCTLGLIRVAYDGDGRYVVLLTRPFVLLQFHPPEYGMDAERGIVRWRIAKGVLVARSFRDHGYLQIDIQRKPPPEPGFGNIRVEVTVANFYPAIASGVGRWLYANTQSRIHVIVTHGFLRSLSRLDLATSRVGRFARPGAEPPRDLSDVPDPPPASARVGAGPRARSGPTRTRR